MPCPSHTKHNPICDGCLDDLHNKNLVKAPKPNKVFYRILRYEGSQEWLDIIREKNAIKPGSGLHMGNGSITEIAYSEEAKN